MSDNLMDKVNALGERLKISGAEVSRKMSTGVTSMSFKMKEFFQGQNMADKIVDEATLETMDGPDWATNLEICDMANTERVNSVELIRAIKRRIMLKSPRVQYLALVLLETIVKNCDKAFSEIAAERVLDEMVKLIDDPQTIVNNRNKALMLIEAWGESGEELRYLPVYEETYKVMGKQKLTVKTEEDSNPRDKYITWTDEATRFMLDWYIELRKDKPATFKFKKQHHLHCADALNGKFSLGVTQTQVDRHYRSFKEKWGWVRHAMANSGNGFDRTTFTFTLSESEKQSLKKTAVNYLTRPIRFFHQLQELFSDQSHADGSLATDQNTVNVDDGSDDSEELRELEANAIPVESSDEADSDTIYRRSPKVDLEGSPLNKKRKRVSSSPSKKPTKGKANKKGKISNDDMAASIKKLADSLASPIVSVQPMPPTDPYANLWKRINALTIPAKDKLEIVAYLSKPDQDIFRSYLNYADETILGEWVLSFFEPRFQEDGGNGGSATAH